MPTFRPIASARSQRAFTLIELMVALSVLAILVAIAAPPLRDAMLNVRMSGLSNDLMSDLSLARSEAVKRGVPVRLCPRVTDGTVCSGSDWSVGWMVFVDSNNDGARDNGATTTELILKTRETLPPGNSMVTNPSPMATLPFRPTGISTTAATTPTFTICDGRLNESGRLITISPTGRAVATRITCG